MGGNSGVDSLKSMNPVNWLLGPKSIFVDTCLSGKDKPNFDGKKDQVDAYAYAADGRLVYRIIDSQTKEVTFAIKNTRTQLFDQVERPSKSGNYVVGDLKGTGRTIKFDVDGNGRADKNVSLNYFDGYGDAMWKPSITSTEKAKKDDEDFDNKVAPRVWKTLTESVLDGSNCTKAQKDLARKDLAKLKKEHPELFRP
jgi:hypothetical protein